MRDWLRRVLFNSPERQAEVAHLDAQEREVHKQTAQIRRIRAEARLAELRLKANR